MTAVHTPLRTIALRTAGPWVCFGAIIGVGCVAPAVDPRVTLALEQVAPRVGELLGIDDGPLPPARVLPRSKLGGAYGRSGFDGVIYVCTKYASMPHTIVAHELVHHRLGEHRPGLPYLLEEGLAQWVSSEVVGGLNWMRARYSSRGPIDTPPDLWELSLEQVEAMDLAVRVRYEQAAFEFVDRAAQPPLESLRFLWDRGEEPVRSVGE